MTEIAVQLRRAVITPLSVTIWALTSVFAAFTGPFGTFEAVEFPLRLFYWGSVVGLSLLWGTFADLVGRRVVPMHMPIRQDIVKTAVMTVLFSPVLFGLTYFILALPSGDSVMFGQLVFYVFCITAGINVLRRTLPGFEKVGYFGSGIDMNPVGPKLARRLPEGASQNILRLSVDDHFVEVVTDEQVHKIRMRFADAVLDMDGIEGFCTHRSHWVAAAAIDRVARQKGRPHLVLRNGDTVPVSRKYQHNLAEAGLI